MKIVPESNRYIHDIRNIHVNAFPSSDEADLVDNLRMAGDVEISLVALEGEKVIGHVLFSKLSAPFKALALAPVAVDTNYRMRSIAKQLIDAGIELARKNYWECIIVLGDPNYYQRFGFSSEMAKGIDCPYSGPYLMAMSLGGFNLPNPATIKYAKAFGD